MDELEKFARWFLDKSSVIGMVPFAGAVDHIEGVTSVLMYRHGQFQVQMFVVPPHTVIPEHTHPDVDNIQVYMGGNIQFSVGGRFVSLAENVAPDAGQLGLAKLRGKMFRVKPSDPHGAFIGEGGGVFLAIQQWLNGTMPDCVARNYNGLTMGEDHTNKVVYGEAYSPTAQLQARDAATLET